MLRFDRHARLFEKGLVTFLLFFILTLTLIRNENKSLAICWVVSGTEMKPLWECGWNKVIGKGDVEGKAF